MHCRAGIKWEDKNYNVKVCLDCSSFRRSIYFTIDISGKETKISIPEMASQAVENLVRITAARIKLTGPYKAITQGNTKAAELLAAMKKMANLRALVFSPPEYEDNMTLGQLFLDLSQLNETIERLHIHFYYRPKSDKWVEFSRYFPNVKELELQTSNVACAFGFKKLINVTIRNGFFLKNEEKRAFIDTTKLLEEIRDANNETAIFIFMNDFKEFVCYTQLIAIFKNHQSIKFTMYFRDYDKNTVFGRQQMKQLTLENMQIVEKRIPDKQHIVLNTIEFPVFIQSPESLESLLFDYLDISIADLRNENLLLFLKKFLQTHKSMRRLKILVPSIWGGLPLVWSILFTQIKAIREFSLHTISSAGNVGARDSIQRIVSDDNSSTIFADIQSCKFYPLPLDNLIILYLSNVRDPDNEQEYLEWFKMNPAGTNYKVIDGKGNIIYARDI